MLLDKKINLALLPQTAQQTVSQKIQLYEQKIEQLNLKIPDNQDFLNSLAKVWCCSLFVADHCIRSPILLNELVSTGDLFSAQHRQDYARYLKELPIDSINTLMTVLRQFRCREMIRIAWRDLAGWSDLDETLHDLTELADVCIQFALDYLYHHACQSKGIPTTQQGTPMNMVVLGMGKLGAWELNYSSDIDLIFAYQEDGELNDRKKTSYGEFFSQICRLLVKVLDEITVDGFVFRTDIRLRPFGDSGAIIMTFEGMETYYITQAREWERYAMIKARPVAGDFVSAEQLMNLLNAFVYRRYLDYGALAELRSLKTKITQELLRKERRDNIKLGFGGIREIEFIGQAFQLIRGGQEPLLQQRSILKILDSLGIMNLLTQDDAEQLKYSYCFLRKVENHIQQYQDKQTHDLPTESSVQQILAFAMNFSNWDSFKTTLDKIRRDVHAVFEQVFSLSESDIIEHASIVWLAEDDNNDNALKYLAQQQFKQPSETFKVLMDFKHSRAMTRLTNKGLEVINRLIPLLIDAVARVENKHVTLTRLLNLLEAVAGRNVYLSLLAENNAALLQLVKLSSASPWICQYLAQYPVLFDELLDTRSLYDPLDKVQLSQQLKSYLRHTESDDIEQIMIKLRQFKQFNILRIAAADIMGVISVTVVSDYLTDVAEVIVETAIDCAWQLLTDKYGFPLTTNNTDIGFAVIGFGKFGGIELGYGSDLDLVFLYDCIDGNALTNGNKPISCTQFYGRLGQKFRHILDTKMLSGVLYEVDMRLRPSGHSGLLVTHINSYEDYLKNQAWTWEHQALVRGRFIGGDPALKQAYQAIRQRVLSLPRNKNDLKKQVVKMRKKMQQALIKQRNQVFDLKHSTGGIVDIEFIVQFHVLATASNNKDLTLYTDNIRLLDHLKQQGVISEAQAERLTHAYCEYRDYGHHQILQGEPALAKKQDFVTRRSQIEHIWHETMGSTHTG